MANRRKRSGIIALMIMLAVCLTVFAACEGDKQIKLRTPTNLQIDGTTLTWKEVENANEYEVNINGEGGNSKR